MKLKYKLPIYNLIILIIGFVLLWVMSFSRIQAYVIEIEHKKAIASIHIQSKEIETLLLSGKHQLIEMSKQDYIQSMDWQRVKPKVEKRLIDSVFQKIGLVYPDKTYFITGTDELGDLSDRKYIDEALATGNVVVSPPLFSRSDNMYQVVIAVPIVEAEESIGILIGAILVEEIQQLVYNLKIDGNGDAFLCSTAGEVYIRSEKIEAEELCQLLTKRELINKDGGYLHYSDSEGNNKIAFFASLEEVGWGIVISIDSIHLYKPIIELFTKAAIAFAVVLLMLVISMAMGIGRFLKQVQKLIQDMKKVEDGNYILQVEVENNDEVGEIGVQFNKTVEAICIRDEELQSLNEELAASTEEIINTNQKLMWAHEEIVNNLQKQKLINQLGENLYTVTDFQNLMEMILVHTQEMVQADRSALFLHYKEERAFKVKSYLNYTDDEVAMMNFKSNEGTFKWMIENKTELFIPDVYDDERYIARFPEDEKYKMLLQLPICNEENDIIGVISYRAVNINLGYIPFLKQLSKMISIALHNSQLLNQIEETYFEVIVSLVKGMELKDSYIKGHSERVMNYSLMIGKKIGLSHEKMNILRYGSILHDIGKMGIPDEILLKKENLTNEEFKLIQEHPQIGEKLLMGLKFLRESLSIIRNHHERFDGTGYPDGLIGKDIPQLTRIVTIADAFDAMTTIRSYRGAMKTSDALEELRRNSGTQFDSDLVDLFIKAMENKKNRTFK
ncbi:HD domain-containing phosphohydrolase [Alkaliphilus peptidifermentans]|uniref:Cache domain-containing protein n=1 Tax=Alkaliphilus peptidifermentans DSM 18978 TaxID=1120976 RepID=A0A1G5HNW0_9FIRM|nr:HD domain-containing phosphohydrolase [Alkaliphilus peptidifermentans]SCY65552.1 Cache domain-containing protein [Alkaliphilus peptidifermentans DSM 18978]